MRAISLAVSAAEAAHRAYVNSCAYPIVNAGAFTLLLDGAIGLSLEVIEEAGVEADILVPPPNVNFRELTNPWTSVRSSEEFWSRGLRDGGQFVELQDLDLTNIGVASLKSFLSSTGDGASLLVVVPDGDKVFRVSGLLFLPFTIQQLVPRAGPTSGSSRLIDVLSRSLHFSIKTNTVRVDSGSRHVCTIAKGKLLWLAASKHVVEAILVASPQFRESLHVVAERTKSETVFGLAESTIADIINDVAAERHGSTLVFNAPWDISDEVRFHPGGIRTAIRLGDLLTTNFFSDWLGYGACQGSDDELTTDVQNAVAREQLLAAQRAIVRLSRNDGALIFDDRLSLRGAGVFLKADRSVQVSGGSRHKSAASFVASNPDSIAVVISQDGPVSVYRSTSGAVAEETCKD
jgi:hypothetical protein